MDIPKISESEWEVMKVLWNRKIATSEEIINEVSQKRSWSRETIKTFIVRLTKKGAVSYEKEGRQYRYYPTLSEEECVKFENKSFLKKVYDGSLGILFANFLEEENLSIDEIEKLEDILKSKKEEKL